MTGVSSARVHVAWRQSGWKSCVEVVKPQGRPRLRLLVNPSSPTAVCAGICGRSRQAARVARSWRLTVRGVSDVSSEDDFERAVTATRGPSEDRRAAGHLRRILFNGRRHHQSIVAVAARERRTEPVYPNFVSTAAARRPDRITALIPDGWVLRRVGIVRRAVSSRALSRPTCRCRQPSEGRAGSSTSRPRRRSALTLPTVAARPRRRGDRIEALFWCVMVCPLMTQQRHWLCTAAMVLMPVSAPIKVLV